VELRRLLARHGRGCLVRGTRQLILLAPPLVIGEHDLADALDLLDACWLARTGDPYGKAAMSFKLTYARCSSASAAARKLRCAVARALAKLGSRHACTLPARSAGRRATL